MLKRYSLFSVMILSCFLACTEPSLFLNYRHFDESWPADQKAVFLLDSLTDQRVNFMIHIRNNSRYPFSNLFLIARFKSGDSLLVCDTLEYALATPQGAWLGSGFLEVKESKLWWKENYKLPKASDLQVELEHALRFNGSEQATDPLEGIVSVGFAVEEILKDE